MRAVQGQPKEVLGFLKAAVPWDGAGWRRVWHRELTIFIYSPLTTTNFFFFTLQNYFKNVTVEKLHLCNLRKCCFREHFQRLPKSQWLTIFRTLELDGLRGSDTKVFLLFTEKTKGRVKEQTLRAAWQHDWSTGGTHNSWQKYPTWLE